MISTVFLHVTALSITARRMTKKTKKSQYGQEVDLNP